MVRLFDACILIEPRKILSQECINSRYCVNKITNKRKHSKTKTHLKKEKEKKSFDFCIKTHLKKHKQVKRQTELMDIIVRVRHSKGFSRLTVNTKDSVRILKEKVKCFKTIEWCIELPICFCLWPFHLHSSKYNPNLFIVFDLFRLLS